MKKRLHVVCMTILIVVFGACSQQTLSYSGNVSAPNAGCEFFSYAPSSNLRPYIRNNTLVSGWDGSRLRGGTFWIFGTPTVLRYKTDWALNDEAWQSIEERGFNAVRVACGYRPESADSYTIAEYTEILDEIIKRAEEINVNVIIDYHPDPGTYYDKTNDVIRYGGYARDFWTTMAARYKANTNVIYELVNEPVFDRPGVYGDVLMTEFQELWTLCDTLAPDVPIIVLSFCAVGYSAKADNDVPAEKAAEFDVNVIDWSKTAVGFHAYWARTPDEDYRGIGSANRMRDLVSKYPCINTEFMISYDSDVVMEKRSIEGYSYIGTLMEKMGISWLQWDIVDREDSIVNDLPLVIEDLKEKNCYWADFN